jgi:hypothetical protein
MAATEPRLPDNFDWKLQLRLNQALQQRAGETAYPWLEESASRRGGWLPAFGAATSIGLAAVLAIAVFMGPGRQPLTAAPAATSGRPSAGIIAAAVPTATPAAADAASLAGRSDRRSLFGTSRGGGLYGPGIQRDVATGGRAATTVATINRGWSGDRLEDLQTIQQLRAQNEQLSRTLLRAQSELYSLKAQLDTTGRRSLDTGVHR